MRLAPIGSFSTRSGFVVAIVGILLADEWACGSPAAATPPALVEEGVPFGMTRQTYVVGDLIRRTWFRGEALVRFFTETIAPESWRQSGGRALIRYDPCRHMLIVCQTPARQEEISQVLKVLKGLSRQAPERMPRGPSEPAH